MSARWITALFLAFGIVWILASDRAIETVTSDPAVLSHIQSQKGIAFVCLSAALIYLLTRRAEIRRGALERQTREQRDHLASILNVSPAVIFALRREAGPDQPWVLDLLGENIADITGYAPEIWFEDPSFWLRHVHPDDKAYVLQTQAQVEKAGTLQQGYRFLCADGGYRWINAKLVYRRGEAGQPDRLIGAWMDDTERRLLEERSRLIVSVFDSSQEGIFITDSQTRFLSINATFTRVTGYTVEELQGKTPAILQSGRQDRTFYADMWTRINTEGQWEGEIWNRRKNGEIYPQTLSITAIRDQRGQVQQYLGVFTETTMTKAAEARIERLANYDALTDLPSRALLADRAVVAVATARQNRQPLVVMQLNVDHFSRINEAMGHEAGDQVIREVARRLQTVLRPEDTLCRLGADDFILLLPHTTEHDVAPVSLQMMEAVARPMSIFGQSLGVTVSIGAAVYPDNGATWAQLSKSAEFALQQAKRDGRNTVRVSSQGMQERVDRELAITRDLRWAVDRGQLVLHYQPQVDLRTGRVVGLEALVRWQHPLWGLVSPALFIPVAEESGLIRPIGAWVLKEALRQLAAWKAAGVPVVPVAVNLSVVEFRQPDLEQLIRASLEEQGVAPQLLELELTESVAMDDSDFAVGKMASLKQLGIALSIDDFGTGYSSLGYLKRFAVDKLKIDQSFVRGGNDDPKDAAIVQTIVGLARNLGLKTIAEGVETQAQFEMLRQSGCDQFQGYLAHRPMPADAVVAVLQTLA